MKREVGIIRSMILVLTLCLLSGCGKADRMAERMTTYVQCTLDASYHGNFETYLKQTDTTEAEAEELYSSMIGYVRNHLIFYASISETYITEEQREKLTDISETLLNAGNYTVSQAQEVAEGDYVCDVVIKPLSFWAQIREEMEAEMASFNEERKKQPELTEELRRELEEKYIDGVIAVCEKHLDQIAYEEEIVYTVSIPVRDNRGEVSRETWDEMDDLILNIAYVMDTY